MDVLLIEDDEGVALVIKKLVSSIGTVNWTRTWDGGLEALGAHKYDVILLDLGLPDSGTYNTLDSVKPLKMNYPDTAIVVITGQPMITQENVIESGADGFVPKSDLMRPTRLIQLISTLVARATTSNDSVRSQLILHEKAATEVSEQIKRND